MRLWDVDTGTLRNRLRVNTDGVSSVAFSPDGNAIASGGWDGIVRLSDVNTGTLRNTLRAHTDYVSSVAFSPDGTTIASGSPDETVRLWDANTGTLRYTLTGHTSAVISVAYSPDGTTLATADWDSTVRLWDANTGTLRYTLTGHTDSVISIAFSPDGTTLATGSESHVVRGYARPVGTVRLWDANTGTLRNTLEHPTHVSSVAFSPDGNTIASGTGLRGHSGGTVHLWDANTGTLLNTLEHRYVVESVAFSPDGNTLASGGQDGILLWDANTGTLRDTLHTGGYVVNSVAFSPDGNIIASGNSDETVRLWDANTGTLLDTLTEHEGIVYSVAFSPDGNIIASASGDRTVRLWDVNTGLLLNTLTDQNTVDFQSVAFSPDGTTLASGSRYFDGNSFNRGFVHLWDANTATQQNELTGHYYSVKSVAFSPDGTTLASGSVDGTVLLWQQTPTNPLPDTPIALNPDSIADQTFTVGTAVSLTLPTATGGTAPYTYSLSPIPIGLQFDTTTQLLSGTPTTATPATSVTYTATDAAGTTASLTFTITVTDATPADITFRPNVIDDLTLSVNTPMELLYLPLAEGGTPPYTYTLEPIPAGLSFDAAIQLLSGIPTTLGTTTATYTATDATGASGSLTFTIEIIGDGPGPGTEPSDVNGDGQVTVIDLAIVALFYGTQVPAGVNLPADVNADGVVNLLDLTAVAQGIDAAGGGLNQLALWEAEAALFAAVEQAAELEAAAGAPGRAVASVSVRLSTKNVSDALATVRTDVRKPQKGFAALEKFLALLVEMTATPETTALLPNYPNPFNPETWIPYHLSKDAEVIVTIYDMRGVAVRELVLGHQAAGVYQSRGRAAYWDGKNAVGEPVASGVYFYTLTAGDFTATRKMLIRK